MGGSGINGRADGELGYDQAREEESKFNEPYYEEEESPKQWVMTPDEMEHLRAVSNNPSLTGFAALATVIRLA